MLGPITPRWIKRLQYKLSDTFFIRPLLGPDLNKLRRELGLSDVQRIFSRWLFESDLPLGLFPGWFGPQQPDWPANTKTVGFPLWDTPGAAASLTTSTDFWTPGRRQSHSRPVRPTTRRMIFLPRPLTPASDLDDAEYCLPSTIISCRRSCRSRSTTLASCR